MRNFETIHKGAPQEVQEAAIAAIVLSALRHDGMEPYQVLGWCAPNDTDADFEQQMLEDHGITVSAAKVKARIHALVVGPEAGH